MIADDHPLILRGLVDLIQSDPCFRVLASTATGLAAIEQIRTLSPDIAVIDLNLPDISGLEVLRRVRASGPDTRFAILTAEIGDTDILSAVSGGVHGIVLKNAAPDMLLACLRKIAAGGRWLPPETVGAAMEREIRRRQMADDILLQLTRREREIILLVSRGLGNREIAQRLQIAEGTAKVHLNSIYSKLNVTNRAALLAIAGEYLDILL